MKFRSGRHMPLSHIIKWTFAQLFFCAFIFGPFIFLGRFLVERFS